MESGGLSESAAAGVREEVRQDYDVVVVGAGMGGIYGVHRLHAAGFRVLGLEAAPTVGGVWYHNRYPGSRVDIDSFDYCYLDPALYREWRWSERYASQPELLRYLEFAADRYDARRHYLFNTRMTGATWDPISASYEVETSSGLKVNARFLVMATGQLSHGRAPTFEGLQEFSGELHQTSRWPDQPVELAGRRVGVIGTGSSGIQTATELAKVAEHLYVFQRTPNYSVPAGPRHIDETYLESRIERAEEYTSRMLTHPFGVDWPLGVGPAADYSPKEQQKLLEERWEQGGPAILATFTDVGRNPEANLLVADFVRSKIRSMVDDPELAEKLCPTYAIGTRRLAVDLGYYQSFNRDNVSLVDVKADPIVRMTQHGVQTTSSHYDLDVIILALGFDAFTGALDAANIRNAEGQAPTDGWHRGPRTYLGLMTTGFPNFFNITGPGSPAVLANLNLQNVFHFDYVTDLLSHMRAEGHAVVEPTDEAQERWTEHCAEVARGQLRVDVDNYMVHINDDGTRVFMPYAGGLGLYVERCNEVASRGYEGFRFSHAEP